MRGREGPGWREELATTVITRLQPAPRELWSWDGPSDFLGFGLVLPFPPPSMSCGKWAGPGRDKTLGEGFSPAEGKSLGGQTVGAVRQQQAQQLRPRVCRAS